LKYTDAERSWTREISRKRIDRHIGVTEERPNRAAWLWGAAEGLSESIGAPLPTFIRDPTEADLPGVRQTLGDERFAAAWTEGRQSTPDAAIAYALQE
jgi:hypothetical protein